MAKRVLLPMDGSEQSRKAFEYALEEYPDGEFVVLHVIDPAEVGYSADPMGMDYWEDWYENAEERAKSLLERVESEARSRDVTVTTQTVTGKPSRAIVKYATEHDLDHVVMGSHGRSGVSRILLGSVAESVVRRSPVPVTVIR